MRERDIEAYLVKNVKALGGEVRKVRWLDRRGAPDRLVMFPQHSTPAGYTYPAHHYWVELKATGQKPEPHQLREHARMARMGQKVLVIDSIAAVDDLIGPF